MKGICLQTSTAVQKHIPFIGYFAHTINLAVSKGLEETSVKGPTGKMQTLVSTFKHSYLKTHELHEIEKLLDLQELQLVLDVATRWNSVFLNDQPTGGCQCIQH
jgi:hypothetical protein